MSNVLRYFGFNNSMVLPNRKLKIQKTQVTEDKVYQTETIHPELNMVITGSANREKTQVTHSRTIEKLILSKSLYPIDNINFPTLSRNIGPTTG